MTPYVGEIRMFGGNFAPAGWALCDGQIVPIAENEALFNLIGTTYGGDGQVTFALPDLRGRIPVHRSATRALASVDGSEQVALTSTQIPAHTHALNASAAVASQGGPAGNVTAKATGVKIYGAPSTAVSLSAGAVGGTGNDATHDNRMPYLAINFIIALYGIFPSQT